MHHPRLRGTRKEMMILVCLFILFKIMHVTAQDDGFLSIDCGLPPNEMYVDPTTEIMYVSDVGFIDTGINMNGNVSDQLRRLSTVRSFPYGARNCYTIDTISAGSKYLVRAMFLYGNYDGLNTQPYVFELHLGVNLWKMINIIDPTATYQTEVITVATADFLSVCLVNIGSGTPFINGLDIRELDITMYPVINNSTSLVLRSRYNLGGPADKIYRYPDDPYDRLWTPFNGSGVWAGISTTSKVENGDQDPFEVPTAIMSTAAIPANSKIMEFYFNFTPGDAPENSTFIIFHFSELSLLPTTDSRIFDIYLNDAVVENDYSPLYHKSNSVYTFKPMDLSLKYHWALNATVDSTLPPILNAIEVYTRMDLTQLPTDSGDVDAVTAIMVEYHMKRNWVGDPCAPMKYSWDGVSCSYTPDPQRIISLNLSSQGLTDVVSLSFANLTALQYLDLSNNNLTGTIPDALRYLPSLKFLDLSGNNLIGQTPASVLTRPEDVLLEVSFVDASPPAPGLFGEPSSLESGSISIPPEHAPSPSASTSRDEPSPPVTVGEPSPSVPGGEPSPPPPGGGINKTNVLITIFTAFGGTGFISGIVFAIRKKLCRGKKKKPNDTNPGTDAEGAATPSVVRQDISYFTIICCKGN